MPNPTNQDQLKRLGSVCFRLSVLRAAYERLDAAMVSCSRLADRELKDLLQAEGSADLVDPLPHDQHCGAEVMLSSGAEAAADLVELSIHLGKRRLDISNLLLQVRDGRIRVVAHEVAPSAAEPR